MQLNPVCLGPLGLCDVTNDEVCDVNKSLPLGQQKLLCSPVMSHHAAPLGTLADSQYCA